MARAVTMRREHLVARFDAGSTATLDVLEPLRYQHAPQGLPAHIRSASALRRYGGGFVIVQDDVNALAVGEGTSSLSPLLLPPHSSGRRVFDDTLGNKHQKLDLEACVILPDGRLVAFGSGSLPAREHLVLWNGREPPVVVAATPLYQAVRSAVPQADARLNIEGAVVVGGALQLFHRGNDTRGAGRAPLNAIVAVDLAAFVSWLDGSGAKPYVMQVTTVDLGEVGGVPYAFTDAVALADDVVVVLACAEDSSSAITDGAVLGCRVGLMRNAELRIVDVCEVSGGRSLLKLEGIERRLGSTTEFDVVVDVDRPEAPAFLGRLVWEWH